jgi:hypothetical protein
MPGSTSYPNLLFCLPAFNLEGILQYTFDQLVS